MIRRTLLLLAFSAAMAVTAVRTGSAAPAGLSRPVRSAEHAMQSPARDSSARPEPGTTRMEPMARVYASERAALFSRAVNQFTSVSEQGDDVVWLGTQLGAKRIDRKRGRVRLFTRAEGLPGDAVAAIAADEGGVAWCAVLTGTETAPSVGLCRFDPGKARWETLRTLTLPPPSPPLRPFHPLRDRTHIAVSPDWVAFAVGPALPVHYEMSGQRAPGQVLLWDKRSRRSQEAVWPRLMGDAAGHAPSVSFVGASGNAFWLGTSAGLLSYRPQDATWRRFLPDRTIHAGAMTTAPGGGSIFWLASERRGLNGAPTFDRFLTRFVPGTGDAREYPQAARAEVPPHRLAVADGQVWLLATTLHGRMSAVFIGFDLAAGTWVDPKPSGGRFLESVPRAIVARLLLRSATRSAGSRSYGYGMQDHALAAAAAYHTPEWISPGKPWPSEAPRWPLPYEATVEEAGGTVAWKLAHYIGEGRVGLFLQREEMGKVVERIPPPQLPVRRRPPIASLALAGDTLYAVTDSLYAFDLRPGVWRKVNANDGGRSFHGTDTPEGSRLIVHEGLLWMTDGQNNRAVRLHLPAEAYEYGYSAGSHTRRLLGVGPSGAWHVPSDNDLYRTLHPSRQIERVTPPRPPGFTPGGAGSLARPVPVGFTAGASAAAGDFIWCVAPLSRTTPPGSSPADAALPDTYNALLGYNTATRTWTAPTSTASGAGGDGTHPAAFRAHGGSVYVAARFAAGARSSTFIQRYDKAANRWSLWAPMPQNGVFSAEAGDASGPSTAALVSVNEAGAWVLDTRRLVLRAWDAIEQKWSPEYVCPAGPSRYKPVDLAVQRGETIFIATDRGVCGFDTGERTWRTLWEVGDSGGTVFRHIAGDRRAVWAVAEDERSGRHYALRLDKTTRQWTLWSAEDGLPEGWRPERLIADGETAWLLTWSKNQAYRLDPRTGRWENLTPRLAPIPVEVADIQADPGGDGRSVWLLTRPTHEWWRPFYTSEVVPALEKRRPPLLHRYDKATGVITHLDPAPDDPLLSGGSLLIEKEAVWVPTWRQGVFRFDRIRETWRRVQAPAAVPNPFPTQRVVRTRGAKGAPGVAATPPALWFVGEDHLLRWSTDP